jgi:predicted small secreted protein
MIRLRILCLALALGLTAAGLAACDEPDGPAEQAGEAVDNTAQRAGEAVEDAGERIQQNAQ